MVKENLVKMRCVKCGNINYYTLRNRKKIKEKLKLKKYCPKCGKHIFHKETR